MHWVGGTPNQLEPYGYAAWSPLGCTLALRNPDDPPRSIDLDAATVFEPVKGTPAVFSLKASYPDQRVKTLNLEQGKPVRLELQPFEVLVFDMRGAGHEHKTMPPPPGGHGFFYGPEPDSGKPFDGNAFPVKGENPSGEC